MATELISVRTASDRIGLLEEEGAPLVQKLQRMLLQVEHDLNLQERYHLPGPDLIDRVLVRVGWERLGSVLPSLQQLFDYGRLPAAECLSPLAVEVVEVRPLQWQTLIRQRPRDTGKAPFPDERGGIEQGHCYLDRRLVRRRAEWELERDKILFFSELAMLSVSMSVLGVLLVLGSHSQISQISATTTFVGIAGVVLRHLRRTD